MDVYKFLILFFVGVLSGISQTLEKSVIGSSGETLTNGNLSLDYTFGEFAVDAYSSGSNQELSQGFHQEQIVLAIRVLPKVMLQGAILGVTGEEPMMRDDLRVAGYLPTTSPYPDGLTCDSSVFDVAGSFAVVDWVYIELRSASNPSQVVAGRSALLLRNTFVVDVNGNSMLSIEAPHGGYYVAVKHRNHLGVMTANPISLSNSQVILDLARDRFEEPMAYGVNPLTVYGVPEGYLAMWAGNVNSNTTVRYQGSGNDSNNIKDNVLLDAGNVTGSNLYSYTGYDVADINLNGVVRYQGAGNDTNIVKDNILAHPDNQTVPSNLFEILEQIPE